VLNIASVQLFESVMGLWTGEQADNTTNRFDAQS
jgi:hypothetical protein